MEQKILTPISLLVFVLLLVLLRWRAHVHGACEAASEPGAATALMIAIIMGSFFNIPVKRFIRESRFDASARRVRLVDLLPQMRRVRRETIIAVNIGGCIIPIGLALYELFYIGISGDQAWLAVAVAVVVNIIACYLVARPIPGVGIVMPSFVSPLVAAVAALLLSPEQAAPVAFIAGVTGPLVGADLFHLKEIRTTAIGMASIGGAGTFDGIRPIRHHCGLSGLIRHSPDALFSPLDYYGIVTALRPAVHQPRDEENQLQWVPVRVAVDGDCSASLCQPPHSGLRMQTQPGCIQSHEQRRPLRRP